MKKIDRLSYFGYDTLLEFVSSNTVFPGVTCDVYNLPENDECDLGIIKIEAGKKTTPQKVLSGSKTIEGYVSGSGILIITKPDGEVRKFSVGPGTEGFTCEIEVGDIMQWIALEDLVIFEVCYPPYKDGRYQNLE